MQIIGIRAVSFMRANSCAIHEGSISLLRDEFRGLLLEAYRAMGSVNAANQARGFHEIGSNGWAEATREIQRRVNDAVPKIATARSELLKFLSANS